MVNAEVLVTLTCVTSGEPEIDELTETVTSGFTVKPVSPVTFSDPVDHGEALVMVTVA